MKADQPKSETLHDLKQLATARQALIKDRTAAKARLATTTHRLLSRQIRRRLGQIEGIASAKQRGVYRRRNPKIDREAIQTRLAEGCSPTEIARAMGVLRGTVYKAKARMTSDHNGNGVAAS